MYYLYSDAFCGMDTLEITLEKVFGLLFPS